MIDWLGKMPGTQQGLMMIFDCIGCNIDEFEKMPNP